MARTLLVAFALTLMLVAAAACSGPSDPEVVPTTEEGYPIVRQDRLRFIPRELTIQPGQAVLFRNDETAIHDVVVNGENVSGDLRKGDEFLWRFDEPGTYLITCTYHPQMRLELEVVAASASPEASD